jgi:hypothetical protein
MVDSRLIGEKPKITLIQRLDGSVFLLGPKGKTIKFEIGAPIKPMKILKCVPSIPMIRFRSLLSKAGTL